jgi:hypothetical protein
MEILQSPAETVFFTKNRALFVILTAKNKKVLRKGRNPKRYAKILCYAYTLIAS